MQRLFPERPSAAVLRSYLFLFACGATAYPTLELFWRGHTHFTMVLLGGLCGLFIHRINRCLPREPFLTRALLSAFAITILEFAVGCLVNLVLDWRVWNYSSHRFHIWGQVCLLYSFYWFLISLPSLAVSSAVSRHLTPLLSGSLFFLSRPSQTKGNSHE